MHKFGKRLASAIGVTGASLLLTLVAAPGAAHAAGPTGCGYGSGGPDAGTLCWLDMSGYDDTQARTAGGQAMSIGLPGGYTANFTITSRPVGSSTYVPVEARTAPLETRFAFGSTAYVGVPSKPVLYSQDLGDTNGVALSLTNIHVADASGAPVTGYSFVIADAENNVIGETFTWTSDVALKQLAVVNPAATAGCHLPLTGIGTTTVTCTGSGGGGGPYNAVLVSADTPGNIGRSTTTFGRTGFAFAIMTSKITVDKSVNGRVSPSDSFDVALTSPESTVMGSASTGAGDSASTGGITVLPRTNNAVYTMSEAATPSSGTDLGAYTQDWSCTNASVSSTTVLPSGAGTSKTVSPQAGDDITCTVTNSAPPIVDTPLVDAHVTLEAVSAALVVVAGVLLVRRRRRAGA
jgi:hypothetical protein